MNVTAALGLMLLGMGMLVTFGALRGWPLFVKPPTGLAAVLMRYPHRHLGRFGERAFYYYSLLGGAIVVLVGLLFLALAFGLTPLD